MTNNRDLIKRLLRLFPTNILKSYFNLKGNNDEIIEIISGNSNAASIIDFAFQNQAFTRQNIYLFEFDSAFDHAIINSSFPLKVEKEYQVSNEYIYFCLPETEYSVYLSNPTEKVNISFLQPITIHIKNKSLIAICTKLEKNIQTYFPDIREAKKASVRNDEEVTIKNLIEFFKLHYNVTSTDFNKGIKAMWHVDDIDCHKIQWRNPHSITNETMDGTMTFKNKYPNEYSKIILTPISKSIWKYLLPNEYLCEGFSADPTNGQLSITKSPKTPNQVQNVITKILANN